MMYRDYFRDRLKDKACVLAYETAAEYLGLFNGYQMFEIDIFVEKNVHIEQLFSRDGVHVHQYVVSNLRNLIIIKRNGLMCTTIHQTIIDLLTQDGDNQVIQESLASYYYGNGEIFDNLKISTKLQRLFEKYKKWAIHYYDD